MPDAIASCPWVARRTTATIRGRIYPAVVLTVTQPQIRDLQYDEFLDERSRYTAQRGFWLSGKRTDARAPMVEVIDSYDGSKTLHWASYRFVFREDAKPEIFKRESNPS